MTAEHDALSSITEVTVTIDGEPTVLRAYWLDLWQIREDQGGQIVDPDSGTRYDLTIPADADYMAATVAHL